MSIWPIYISGKAFPTPRQLPSPLFCYTDSAIGDAEDDDDCDDDDCDDNDDSEDGEDGEDDDDVPLLPLECWQVWEDADVQKGFKELLIRFRTQLLMVKIAHEIKHSLHRQYWKYFRELSSYWIADIRNNYYIILSLRIWGKRWSFQNSFH